VRPDELLTAVRKLAAGGRYVEAELAQALATQPAFDGSAVSRLSAREVEILRLLSRGSSLSQIADSLGLGYKTVANTLSQVKTKLGVQGTAALVRLALETGLR
jgi:DNA-binding NarL/FixJ family response regulator